jgi:hypothetical protein
MSEEGERIDLLLKKIETLVKRQETLSEDLKGVREELNRLKIPEPGKTVEKAKPPLEIPADKIPVEIKKEKVPETIISPQEEIKSDLEKFIGENLINKIGIAITVIGVSIGAKYAIDHDLISPLTRIMLGYLVGLGLLFFALRLRKNYDNFSAVLLSGSLAIMYFLTYAAYSFYAIYPQWLTFILMVIFTAAAVTAAIDYNKQVIAHIGLVGAYAVPFLLSQGPEDVVVLFSYTAIINVGILVISFKKYWKPLYYSSFLLTWLMFMTWYGSKYQASEHLVTASVFLSVFFVTFYLMFLAYKLIQKEKFDIYDIVLLLANSFIFYGLGYNILTKHDSGEHLTGLFTLFNAAIHTVVSLYIYRQKLADRNLFHLVSGLVLIFITIAIPVQLSGNWITLLWAGEAALLFWIGRTKKVAFYEILSYALIYLAFFSIIYEWSPVRNINDPGKTGAAIIPFFNADFLTSILFTAAFGFINCLNRNPEHPSPIASQDELMKIVSFSISAILLLAIYFSFSMEISKYWDKLYNNSLIEINVEGRINSRQFWNTDFQEFKKIWLINYSLMFFSVLSFINIRKIKNRNWGFANIGLSTLVMVIFLIQGLYSMSELRETYLNQPLPGYYQSGIFNIAIRYVSFVFAGLMLASLRKYVEEDFIKPVPFDLNVAYDILLSLSLVWIISSELLSWMDIMKSTQSYKLALSILWGMYSLLLISAGIWKNKKHLRIGAIALFGVTLIKLFFYDISHLDTISKTIVFVTLGILLLIISFLYNKYKSLIF